MSTGAMNKISMCISEYHPLDTKIFDVLHSWYYYLHLDP